METSPAVRDAIALEATEWFVRLQQLVDTAEERTAFSEWLTRSPLHVQEFLAVSSAWALIEIPSDERFEADTLIADARIAVDAANVLEFVGREARPCGASRIEGSTPRADRRWISIAAAIAFAIAGVLGYQLLRPVTEFVTVIGEQRSISLADGSVVFLNTNSKVRVRWTAAERQIELVQGEARFQVAKNAARPFVVATPQATVRAIGTVFNVLADQRVTQVTVIEGRVNLRAYANATWWSPLRHLSIGERLGASADTTATSSIDLSAGERAAIDTRGRIDPNSGPPVERVDAWTARRLVFRNETLDKVVAEFNRYHDLPMVVDDAQLAGLKINGVFDSSDPEALVVYLQTFEAVATRVAADGRIHLSIIPAVTTPHR